jgi:hypothetical protein
MRARMRFDLNAGELDYHGTLCRQMMTVNRLNRRDQRAFDGIANDWCATALAVHMLARLLVRILCKPAAVGRTVTTIVRRLGGT